MKFTTSKSIQRCRDILNVHESNIPVFADTSVEMYPTSGIGNTQFTLKRLWKGMKGLLKYSVMELVGDLKYINDNTTEVNASIQPREMSFVAVGIAVVVGLVALSDVDNRLYLFVPVLLIGMLIYDFYVLNNAINSLKTPS